MFKLQKINVIRIVETEEAKLKLLNEGFIEVVQEVANNVKKTIKKAKE